MVTRIIKTDVLIIGAGLIGSAVALGLAKKGCKSVTIVDLDLAGEWSSSELNAGGVRGTWSQKVNLLTSKFSIEYFAKVADQVGYRDCGYLWLHREPTWKAALKAQEMHIANDWPVSVLDVAAIRARLPFIDKTDDLVGGLFGVKDGLVNPNRVKEHYREEAIRLGGAGIQFLDGVWVNRVEAVAGSNHSHVSAIQFSETLTSEEKKKMLTENPLNIESPQGSRVICETGAVVNCAGAWAPHLASILGYISPSKPVRRQISLFHARDLDLTPYGMIIDPSGVYFHPESIYGLSGYATPNEVEGFNFNYDGQAFFEEHIWANLYERSTAFESLKHVSGWAGLYENSPDHHAIVGEVVTSGRAGSVVAGAKIFEAHSFSGHGAMQSYGVGIALAELIANGRYETLDLTSLSSLRFTSGARSELSGETWVI